MTCALILSLCFLGGCSKDDDGPESGSVGNGSVKGSVKVDGKKFDLKSGYKIIVDDDEIEYVFYDQDILKYAGAEGTPNIEISCLALVCEGYSTSDLLYVGIGYKQNPSNNTGWGYEGGVQGSFEKYGSFSVNKGNVKCSAESLPLRGYILEDDESYLGMYNATFSVDGNPVDMSDFIDEYSTRGIQIVEVTDPNQIAFLKKFMPKRYK